MARDGAAYPQRQLYLEDTYLLETVTAVLERGVEDGVGWVLLRDNIFHPQGGGQPADVGTVEAAPAWPRRLAADPHLVVLDLAGDPPPDGEQVRCAVDVEVRLRHAALHTAGHLVDAVMQDLGFRHVANNHFPGQARVEYDVAGRPADLDLFRATLEERTATAIAARLPVRAGRNAEGLRTITIEGMATEPCGGTHLADLGQLASLVIRSVKVKGGRLRVGYTAGHLAPREALSGTRAG